MNFVSAFDRGHTVEEALNGVVKNVNEQLKNVDGLIDDIDFQIDVGYSGATVSVAISLNGDEPLYTEIIGVNQRGINTGQSLKKATEVMNNSLMYRKGVIKGFAVENIEPIPGRAYSTIIAAINEDKIKEPSDSISRRRRIKKSLELLNREPSALNIAKVAEVFGVSRKMIYHDLEALGFDRKDDASSKKK